MNINTIMAELHESLVCIEISCPIHSIVEAVNLSLHISEVSISSQVVQCGICGARTDSVTSCYQSLSVITISIIIL
jgi:hypothetical protein